MTQLIQIALLVAALKEMAPVKKPTIKEMTEKTKREDVSGPDISEAWNQYQGELKKASGNIPAKSKKVDGIFVRAAPGIGSFRRAGYNFDETGVCIELDALSKEQLRNLKNEKRLIVKPRKVTVGEALAAE